MSDPAKLSKQQLLELVKKKNEELALSHKELAQEKDINRQLAEKYRQLEKEYLQLFREKFGRKSERYIADPDQLRLDFGDTDDAADCADGLAEAVEEAQLIPAHTRGKRKKKATSFPAHFPRIEKVVDVEPEQKECPEHGERELLPESMWDVREKLVIKPAVYEVLRTKYKKYRCKNQPECGIASPERPTGIVEGDKYDTSVATHIITHKYAYFLTLYRLQHLFAGSGWMPSRGLLLNILQGSHFVIEPLPSQSLDGANTLLGRR
ncbi:MAG: transposase [Planctomycetales bacterium]|nr:transposase [Planctomycetales bacterium]